MNKQEQEKHTDLPAFLSEWSMSYINRWLAEGDSLDEAFIKLAKVMDFQITIKKGQL